MTTVIFHAVGTGSYTIPSGATSIAAKAIGSGGGGACGYGGGGGGGGGEYRAATLSNGYAGNSYTYKVPAGGARSTAAAFATAGSNAYFKSTAVLNAKGAVAGGNVNAGGVGGSAGTGSLAHANGGTGGVANPNGDTLNSGGGGGAGGPKGAGGAGQTTGAYYHGGAGDTASAAAKGGYCGSYASNPAGKQGYAGVSIDGSHGAGGGGGGGSHSHAPAGEYGLSGGPGGLYGGGGGGGSYRGTNNKSGAGAQGLVWLTFTSGGVTAKVPWTFFNMKAH